MKSTAGCVGTVPFLPMAATGPIPDLRRQFDAIMWRFRVGSPWRDVPEGYGNWSTIYGQFQSWALKGIFQALMDGMIAEAAARGQVDLSLVSVDSTVARAHHHAAGMVVDAELLAGAHLDGRPLHVSETADLGLSIVATGRARPDEDEDVVRRVVAAMTAGAVVGKALATRIPEHRARQLVMLLALAGGLTALVKGLTAL